MRSASIATFTLKDARTHIPTPRLPNVMVPIRTPPFDRLTKSLQARI